MRLDPDGDDMPRSVSATGRSVRLYLADGIPAGLIVAEIGNWSGKVLAAPRGRLGGMLKRSEVSRTGIYVLTGPDPERLGGTIAYIGEADDVAARLRIHLRSGDKDFFTRLAIVVSSDDNLTKAHVRFIESKLIRLVRQAGIASLTNGTDPDFQRLPEADRADMEFFVEQLTLVLPIVGFDLFRRSAQKAASEGASNMEDDIMFVFATTGALATAREAEEGFVVLAGSTARRRPTETFPAGYLALRNQLLADGKLTDGPASDLYTFTSDVIFTSPSAAASIVAARSASGPREWKVNGTGQMYKDWKAAALEQG
jgi:hypothetical protein